MPKKFTDMISRVADFKAFVDENGDLIFEKDSSLIESGDLDGGAFSLNRAYMFAKTETARNTYPRSLNWILTTYSEASGSVDAVSGNAKTSGNSDSAESTGSAGDGIPADQNWDDAVAVTGSGVVNTSTSDGKKTLTGVDVSGLQVGDVIRVGGNYSSEVEYVTITSIEGSGINGIITVNPPFTNDHTGDPVVKKGSTTDDWYQNDLWGWFWISSDGQWIYSNKYSTWIFVGNLTEKGGKPWGWCFISGSGGGEWVNVAGGTITKTNGTNLPEDDSGTTGLGTDKTSDFGNFGSQSTATGGGSGITSTSIPTGLEGNDLGSGTDNGTKTFSSLLGWFIWDGLSKRIWSIKFGGWLIFGDEDDDSTFDPYNLGGTTVCKFYPPGGPEETCTLIQNPLALKDDSDNDIAVVDNTGSVSPTEEVSVTSEPPANTTSSLPNNWDYSDHFGFYYDGYAATGNPWIYSDKFSGWFFVGELGGDGKGEIGWVFYEANSTWYWLNSPHLFRVGSTPNDIFNPGDPDDDSGANMAQSPGDQNSKDGADTGITFPITETNDTFGLCIAYSNNVPIYNGWFYSLRFGWTWGNSSINWFYVSKFKDWFYFGSLLSGGDGDGWIYSEGKGGWFWNAFGVLTSEQGFNYLQTGDGGQNSTAPVGGSSNPDGWPGVPGGASVGATPNVTEEQATLSLRVTTDIITEVLTWKTITDADGSIEVPDTTSVTGGEVVVTDPYDATLASWVPSRVLTQADVQYVYDTFMQPHGFAPGSGDGWYWVGLTWGDLLHGMRVAHLANPNIDHRYVNNGKSITIETDEGQQINL